MILRYHNPMSAKFLTARHLRKSFPSGGDTIAAVDGFSYSFPSSGLYCFTGESGSGKTTLLHVLSGLSKPDQGEVVLQGESIYADRKETKRLRQSFGYVFQEGNLLEDRTVKENMLLVSTDKGRMCESLKRFGVLNKLDVPVARLSGGEKQRVAIARCFFKGARILVLDEPTASLDERNGTLVFDAIKQASEEVLCLVSTHNQKLASAYADVCFFLKKGMVEEKTGEPISAQENDPIDAKPVSKGKMPLFYGWRNLWKKKGKAIATTIVSTLSLFFLIAGASFAFFDATPAFECALKESDTWFLPLNQYARSEEGNFWGNPISGGKYYKESIQGAFGETFAYRIGHNVSAEGTHTTLNVIPYFEGLEIHKTKIRAPQSGEAVVSSFFHDLVGSSFSVTVEGTEKSFETRQIVPISYEPKELTLHKENIDYQQENEGRFSSYYTYLIVSAEDFSSFRDSSEGVSLRAANCFYEGTDLNAYVNNTTHFQAYQGQELLLGRAPENEGEIVAPRSLLDSSRAMESYLGTDARFIDLNQTSDPRRYSSCLNVYDIVPNLEIVGVADGIFAYLHPDLLERFSMADWENGTRVSVDVKDVKKVASKLGEMEFRSNDALFRPIYEFEQIKNSGLGIAFMVIEALLAVMSAAVGFSLGQDGITGKEKEIALLLTLGQEEKDFLARYFLGCGVFLGIAFLLALGFSGFALWMANLLAVPSHAYALFQLSYQGILLAIAVSFLTAFLSSLGSLHRLNRLQIADIFRGKE